MREQDTKIINVAPDISSQTTPDNNRPSHKVSQSPCWTNDLEGGAGSGDDGAAGRGLCGYGASPGAASVCGQAPGCGQPFGVLAGAGREGMGRCACRAAGSIRGAAAPPGAGARPAGDHALPVSGA